MEFEKDKDTKEMDNDDDDKAKSSEDVSIKDSASPEKLPLSDDDDDDDDKNSDSKSSSAPNTDDKKKKPWVFFWDDSRVVATILGFVESNFKLNSSTAFMWIYFLSSVKIVTILDLLNEANFQNIYWRGVA